MNAITKTELNPIGAMVETLAPTPTKKPRNKTSKPVVSFGIERTNALFVDYVKAHVSADNAISSCNVVIQQFIDSGVTFVKLSQKSLKETPEYKFTESCKANLFNEFKKVKAYPEGTLENYWKAFSNAVNDKTLLLGLNVFRNKKPKGKDSKDKTQEQLDRDMTKALTEIWSLSDVSTKAIKYIESKQESGLTLIEAITDFLKSDGVVLPE
jgi:hypothetical protein